MVLLAGFAGHLTLESPSYVAVDERAHVGYLLSLQKGSLPTIDSPIPIASDPGLRNWVAFVQPPHRRDVWVANNPPFVYLAAMPLAQVGSWAGATSPGLVGLRWLSVIAGMGAVMCSYLLARELSGGDILVGVAGAGLVAGTMGVALVSSLAFLDAPAFLATTGLSWAVARAARSCGPGDLWHVGMWAALAAAVRPMSAAFAGVAVVIVAAFAWRDGGWRALARASLRLAGPAAVLTGWFYGLNLYRYGDPTGSAALFEKLQRGASDSGLVEVLLNPSWLGGGFQDLIASVDLDFWTTETAAGVNPWLASTASFVAIALVIVALGRVLTASGAPGSGAPGSGFKRVVPRAWLSMIVLATVTIVLVAQHVSSGGYAHPRYLLPLVPVVATAAAMALRDISRWAPLVGVICFTGWGLARIGAAAEGRQGARLGQEAGAGPLLGVTVIGAVVLVVALAAITRSGTTRHISISGPDPSGRPEGVS